MSDAEGAFIVVPAFNEAAVLRSTLNPLLLAGHRVVVVDDGSEDDTEAVARSLPVFVLRHAVNLGQGAALETGTRFAVSVGARYVVHFDADGQHTAESIDALLAPLVQGTADVALGSRFLRVEDAARVPGPRRLVLKLAIWVNYLLTGMLLSDAHNGLRAMTREAVSQLHLSADRYDHATEILSKLRRAGLRYVEVPTRIEYTEYSRAKGQRVTNAVNILVELLLRKIFR